MFELYKILIKIYKYKQTSVFENYLKLINNSLIQYLILTKKVCIKIYKCSLIRFLKMSRKSDLCSFYKRKSKCIQ